MDALVYDGTATPVRTSVPDPVLQDDEDVVVRVETTTICGTDLHILRGHVPTVAPGRVLGHEAVGTVVAAGPGVRNRRVGDRVVVSCISGCGRCRFCREGSFGQCRGGGGWVLGHRIDGTQADLVRVPYADLSTHRVPESVPDAIGVLLSDVLPTAFEVGVTNGRVSPGDVVVVVGAGPIGLGCVTTARLLGPRSVVVVDPAATRRDAAKQSGADLVVGSEDAALEAVAEITDGLGADVAIEAVGLPESFELCTDLIRPGGHVANVGVHGSPALLHLETLWDRNVTVTTGLVDTRSTPTLLRMVAGGQVDLGAVVTHTLARSDVLHAYDIFGRADRTGALKVVLTGDRRSTS